jgi:hypothetical protein
MGFPWFVTATETAIFQQERISYEDLQNAQSAVS